MIVVVVHCSNSTCESVTHLKIGWKQRRRRLMIKDYDQTRSGEISFLFISYRIIYHSVGRASDREKPDAAGFLSSGYKIGFFFFS